MGKDFSELEPDEVIRINGLPEKKPVPLPEEPKPQKPPSSEPSPKPKPPALEILQTQPRRWRAGKREDAEEEPEQEDVPPPSTSATGSPADKTEESPPKPSPVGLDDEPAGRDSTGTPDSSRAISPPPAAKPASPSLPISSPPAVRDQPKPAEQDPVASNRLRAISPPPAAKPASPSLPISSPPAVRDQPKPAEQDPVASNRLRAISPPPAAKPASPSLPISSPPAVRDQPKPLSGSEGDVRPILSSLQPSPDSRNPSSKPASPAPQNLVMPPPLPENLPPQGHSKPPLVTTDLQGNLGMIASQNTPPAASIPQTDNPPTTAEEPSKKRGNFGLLVFGILTLMLVAFTVIMGYRWIGPSLQSAIDSKLLQEDYEFENVLLNLLQIENQEIEVKLTDSQFQKIVPDLDNQAAVSDGKVIVNSTFKLEYPDDASTAGISSEFRFDLDLQIDNRRENLIIDVTTVSTAEGFYFKLEDLQRNGQQLDLEATGFGGRWSNLDALLQPSEDTAQPLENESVFLNYIANLLKLYSHPHYVSLLPAFNISSSRHYNQVKDILLASGAYDLDSGSCSNIRDAELECTLRVDYAKLHDAYQEIYAVIGREIPAYYGVLETTDRSAANLPSEFKLVFDKDRDYPISLSIADTAADISASSLIIDYKNFDESSPDIAEPVDPLDISEYHEQILRYEQEVYTSN